MSWSQDAQDLIVGALGEVPYVGGLLGAFVEIFWPSNSVDVWGEIRAQVQQVINAAISTEVYNNVQSVLGSAAESSGLIGVLSHYLEAVNGIDGENVQGNWIAANIMFIGNSGMFQQNGSEILLLPLFAQMANLHLSLLRDGVLQKFCLPSELQERMLLYTQYATNWTTEAVAQRSASKPYQFNLINQVARFMQINVLNFVRLWIYFDPTLYPNPVQNISAVPSEIFYTILETIPGVGSIANGNYAPPGALPGSLNQIDLYSVVSNQGDWTMIGGCDVGYDSGAGTTGYIGVLCDGTVPVLNTPIYSAGEYYLSNTLVGTQAERKAIFRIDGNWSWDYYIRYLQFTFQDLTYTRYIPSPDDNGDSNTQFTIIPPSGYSLSSIWMPSTPAFYTGAYDAVFGFQDFGRYVNWPDSITINPQQWAETCPVTNSSNWVTGYSVQYAIAWLYADGNFSNLTPWCDPIFGGPWAMPTLILPTSTDPNIVGRQLFRKFEASIVQNLTTLDATTQAFTDSAM